MTKFGLVLTCVLLTLLCYSQSNYAVISDKDGYLNVRKEPGNKSPIIGRIEEDEIFWAAEEESRKNWIYVNFLQKMEVDSLYTRSDKILDGRVLRYGYVHRSSVRRLGMPERDFLVNADAGPDNFMAKDSLVIYMSIGRPRFTDSLSVAEVWGTDLRGVVMGQINRAYLQIHKKRYSLDFLGFYEPVFSSTELIYDQLMDDFIITMSNSSGAGYYLCAWQVSEDGAVKRYAFRPY